MASAVAASTSANNLQMDYMKLLVTQLQNQNPLEPMSSYEMSAQLTQFSQLNQMESMNTSFSDVLATTEHNYATSLIGKTVMFVGETSPGVTGVVSGKIDQVLSDADGKPVLGVGTYAVGLKDIISVKE